MATIECFECSECGARADAREVVSVCPDCSRPYLVRYDLTRLESLSPSVLAERRRDLWRYHEVLPTEDGREPVSLGEGFTPLTALPRLGRRFGVELLAKNEAFNPTGSFKDRGMAVAIDRVAQRGGREVRLPSAGNAASSAAAYAARAGLRVHVAMPRSTPSVNHLECVAAGARVQMVEGSIRDAGQWLAAHGDAAATDLSTLKEPFRLEGKKTMGYELYEQGRGDLPDAIVYPTGGGTGLIGMAKAFDELEQAGRIRRRPRLISVQAAGCAPIVHAFEAGLDQAEPVSNPVTIAAGLRVPAAIGDRLMLRAIRASEGCAVRVTDDQIAAAARELAREEGILTSSEAAATLAALPVLQDRGALQKGETVVVFLTASGLKNLEWHRAITAGL